MEKRLTQYPSKVSDIADGEDLPRFIVLQDESFHYSNDGYGSSGSTPYVKTLVFYSKETLQDWVEESHSAKYSGNRPSPYKIFSIEPVTVNVKTVIEIK